MNLLSKASSPYLLQHKDNPVEWREWNSETLKLAEELDKPIIISVGYAACHWCHVMAHESFEDNEVAKLMNAHFICIKIDREERPDIDQIYMDAAQILTGRAGWPLNAFAFPDGRPFYAATYFPKDNWKKVLTNVAEAYASQREQLEETANKLTQGIQDMDVMNFDVTENTKFSKTDYKDFFGGWINLIDRENGGFKGAPKFPMPSSWLFLLDYHYYTKNQDALDITTNLLDGMHKGGIYDQIHGGFARYSVDDKWFAPHFEKMLYDNAQLINLYSKTYQLTQNSSYEKVIRQSLDFIKNELTAENGGFYSALDADSDGKEGAYYTYHFDEVKKILTDEEFKIAESYFGLKENGNWEDEQNIFYKAKSINEVAQELKIDQNKIKKDLEIIISKIKKNSLNRNKPSLDDKILCSWNAMMMLGYINAYKALKDESYLVAAIKNADFLNKNLIDEKLQVYRNYKNQNASIPAFLEDYAWLAQAFCHLYQVTFESQYLERSKELTDITIKKFYDSERGIFYYTSAENSDLIARKIEINDNVIPASNSVMLNLLIDLSQFYPTSNYSDIASQLASKIHQKIYKSGPYLANWARGIGKMVHGQVEIVCVGHKALEKAQELQHLYFGHAVYMGENTKIDLVKDKRSTGDLIYICQDKVCQQPVKTVAEAHEILKNL